MEQSVINDLGRLEHCSAEAFVDFYFSDFHDMHEKRRKAVLEQIESLYGPEKAGEVIDALLSVSRKYGH